MNDLCTKSCISYSYISSGFCVIQALILVKKARKNSKAMKTNMKITY